MDITTSVRAEIGGHAEGDGRRRAFEANLTAALTDALGDTLHPTARRTLVSALGEAHEDVGHLIDARAAIGPRGRRRYAVLQLGFVGRAPEIDGGGPLARRVFARIACDALADLTARERRVLAACVERSELRNVHPVDWRPRVALPLGQVYLNLLAGRDRRGPATKTKDDRRAPANELVGLVVLTVIAVLLSGAGLWLIGRALFGVFTLLSDPQSLALLVELFRI